MGAVACSNPLMVTLKLSKPAPPRARGEPTRPPVRGQAAKKRPVFKPAPGRRAGQPVTPETPQQTRHDRSREVPRRDPPARAARPEPDAEQRLAEGRRWLAEREARYQEQLVQRFGDRIPPEFSPRSAPIDPDHPPAQRQPSGPRNRRAAPNTAFDRRSDHDRVDRDEAPEPLPVEHAPGSMRLSKRMSELGLASRREADEWIAKGWVRVDEQIVSELGSRVVPAQRITVDAKARFQQAQRVTVLINKPIGFVSGQAEDGYEPAYVLVTPANQWTEDHSGTRFLRDHLRQLAPAGRLDIDSTGMLVLTQDGRVAKQLIGEESAVEKEYLVRVEPLEDGTSFDERSLALLNHGLELDGEALRPARVEWLNRDQLRFVLTQGKKRQVRRMCELVGLKVVGLKRVRIAGVMLGDLPLGQWRYLRRDETFV